MYYKGLSKGTTRSHFWQWNSSPSTDVYAAASVWHKHLFYNGFSITNFQILLPYGDRPTL